MDIALLELREDNPAVQQKPEFHAPRDEAQGDDAHPIFWRRSCRGPRIARRGGVELDA